MQKIKSILNNYIESEKGKDILIIFIVVLVGIVSFYLGRLSKESSQDGLKIEYKSQEASAIGSSEENKPIIELNPSISERTQKDTLGKYFASKRGKKYYPIECSAGKTIKQENRIYFSTTQEAENAGYSLSSSC